MLCSNRLDAIAFTVGHPSGMIKEATNSCSALIIPVTGAAIDKLITDKSYYRVATIPGGIYKGNPVDIKTFGVGAVLVASDKLKVKVVQGAIESVFNNLDSIRKQHPALKYLDLKEMALTKNTAPLHHGAEKYFQDTGLLR